MGLAAIGFSTAQEARKNDFDLSPEQRTRLAAVLPKSLPKLEKRLPFHAVVLGDEVAGGGGFDQNAGNVLLAYPAEFLELLAGQFFYAGGVRVVKPAGKHPAKRLPLSGDEITLRSLAGRGRLALDGGPMWEALGKNPAPDLVIIGYGSAETAANYEPAHFGDIVDDLVKSAQAAGADVIITSPTLIATEPVERGLAATRPYAIELARVAALRKCAFVDLGDLQAIMRLPPLDPGTAPVPEDVFEGAMEAYLNHFRWPVENQTLPQPTLHRLLGRQIFRALLDGAPVAPWNVRKSTVQFSDPDTFVLKFSVQNPGTEPLPIMVLPLVPSGWLPQDASPEGLVKPGKSYKAEVTYKRDAASAEPIFTDGMQHLPVLVSNGSTIRIEDLAASVSPVTLRLPPRSQYSVEKSVKLSNIVTNSTGAPIPGAKWTAEMDAVKLTGTVDLPPGPTALPIELPLPDTAETLRKVSQVKVTVTAGTQTLAKIAKIEFARHMGLKQNIPLTTKAKGKNAGPGLPLRCLADSTALYLTVDISAVPLEDDEMGTALVSSLSLDARSFDKRLKPGAVEPVRYRLGVADGYGETSKLSPWAFGNGYAAEFDPGAMTIRLQSGANGQRRVTWVVPRSYLYLHDFTPGNGNSHLGINLTLQFYRQAGEGVVAGFPPGLSYSLNENARLPQDAGSLSVLELTDEPTKRWSAVQW